jgi:hypothetical protein
VIEFHFIQTNGKTVNDLSRTPQWDTKLSSKVHPQEEDPFVVINELNSTPR